MSDIYWKIGGFHLRNGDIDPISVGRLSKSFHKHVVLFL